MKFGSQARSFGEGVYKEAGDFLLVVREMGEVGFGGLETNWMNLERYYDRTAELKAILGKAQLTLVGAHMGANPWGEPAPSELFADAARTAEFLATMGGEFIVLSGSPPEGKREQPDAWRQTAELVNEVGRVCADGQVRCLYHTHWWECEGDGLEQLFELCDPGLVDFAFDTGHAVRAGRDAVTEIGMLAGRIGMLHLTDWDGERRPPLGEGRIDLPAVAAALGKVGFDGWVVLEEETQFGSARPQVERGLAVFKSTFGKGTSQ